MIKAVFFDVDGTLLSFKTHKVPLSTVEALEKLKKNNIKIFIATGRHQNAIKELEYLGFDGYVTLNGGICTVNNRPIYKHPISDDDINSLIVYMNNVEPIPCIFVENDGLLMNYKDKSVEDVLNLLNYPDPPICSLEKIVDKTIYQILAFFTEKQESRIMEIVPDCESARWHPLFTDVVPSGSNKWVGISKVLEYLDIDLNKVMVFGDGGNDIHMLSQAAIGVAMGNAKDEVKKHADYVTDSVDDNGVKNALEHFGLI